MKITIINIFLAISLVIISQELYSKELPKSFLDSNFTLKAMSEVEFIVTDIPNSDSLNFLSDSLYEAGVNHPAFYGVAYDYDINIGSDGTWDTLLNGDRLWRYHIICPNSFSINFVFENMYIADNSNLSFYNENNESLIGPLNSRINREHGVFSSHTIDGQSVYLEFR